MWSEVSIIENGIQDDPQTFWAGIKKYENATGQGPYKDLLLYALTCLSCPGSNAAVERIFSILASVKTNYRNQMSNIVLDCFVRIRSHLIMKDICCTNFEITNGMLENFTSDMYDG